VITWQITEEKSGVYRIRHFGLAKKSAISSELTAFEGKTINFNVTE
jgi:hypothetical protein